MRISGIYKIQSIIKPKKAYIGSAVNIDKRWGNHLSDLRLNKHSNGRLQNHYNKYGESDLQFSILLGCEKGELIANEQFFIDSYKPFFNICIIAGSNLGCRWKLPKGRKASDETRKILSNARKGIVFSKETRMKFSKALIGNKHGLGYKHTKEAINKITEASKNRECSDETRKKMSKPKSVEHCQHLKEAWVIRKLKQT